MSTIDPGMEIMLDAFTHETESMLDQLDEILLESERAKSLSNDYINDIFRITHTIKGSAAMMGFDSISNLAHAVEDVFYVLREEPTKLSMVFDTLFDLVLLSSDFLKVELEKIQGNCEYFESDPKELIEQLHMQAAILKGEDTSSKESISNNASDSSAIVDKSLTRIRVFFEDDCQMENMRAFMLLSQLEDSCDVLLSDPSNPEQDGSLCAQIAKDGFVIFCKPSHSLDEVVKVIESSISIKSYEVLSEDEDIVSSDDQEKQDSSDATKVVASDKAPVAGKSSGSKQSLISVNQAKLDHLMDLVGELVTAESMVARNPDLAGLKLDNFTKSIRDLRKLTDELQDVVMSIRMVPLQGTFHKMDRIVRDMCKKLDKNVDFVSEGGDTEVDKTINDSITDPLMHMIRNSMDHAIEPPDERIDLGKSDVGLITLSAKSVGGEIFIQISDDGRGLDAAKLLAKAKKNGILTKPENEYTDKEAFGLIMLPGFSTNEAVTEFSGRGVGMDVVRKNIEQVGGTISIDSVKNQGTTFTIKIPLTLAIMDGMNVSVGKSMFTLPMTSITQSFKVSEPSEIINNTNGTQMIMIRGECYPVFRLHELFGIETKITDICEGILIQVESANSTACIFADELLGEYQVVVKPFPAFFNKYNLKDSGLSGCSILGDGSITLILDTNGLLNNK